MTKGICSSKRESSLKETRIAGGDFSCPLYLFEIWISVISGHPTPHPHPPTPPAPAPRDPTPTDSFTKWSACNYVKGKPIHTPWCICGNHYRWHSHQSHPKSTPPYGSIWYGNQKLKRVLISLTWWYFQQY